MDLNEWIKENKDKVGCCPARLLKGTEQTKFYVTRNVVNCPISICNSNCSYTGLLIPSTK